MSAPLRNEIAHFVLTSGNATAELDRLVRVLLTDYLGVAHRGAQLRSSQSALASVESSPHFTAEFPATIWGVQRFAESRDAAFANAVCGHGLELDDTYEPSSLHPGVVIFSSAFALAQARDLTWVEMARAVLIGYDVMAQIGVYVGSEEMYGRGFHPTGVAGALGAAAVWAALSGLDEAATQEAISLAANMAAGSLEFLSDGSWTKRLNAGHATTVGFRAGELAAQGFTGPELAIEGRNGLAVQYGQGSDPSRVLSLEFGRSAQETSIKFFPCCRYMHGVMDLLAAYRAEHPDFDVNSLDRIDAAVITAGQTLVSEPPAEKLRIATPVDAQFSMPFGAAAALLLDEVTLDVFDHAPDYAHRFAPLMAKVRCVSDGGIDAVYPRRWAASVTLHFLNGESEELHEPAFVGSPQNPASAGRMHHKAVGLIGEHSASALTQAVAVLSDDTRMANWMSREVIGP